jgi:hypothetical protein
MASQTVVELQPAASAVRLLDSSGPTFTCINAWSLPLHSHSPGRSGSSPDWRRSARVRVGAVGAAAGPSMAGTVKDPLLKDLPAGVVEVDRAGVGHAAWRLATRVVILVHALLLPCLGDDRSLLTGLF